MGTESERTTANPGSPSRTSHCSAEEGCITCGDVAVELEVVELDADRGLALCRDEEDRRETVEIALVLPVEARDRLLVHAGTAIAHAAPSPSGTPGRAAEDFAPSPSGTPGRAAEEVAG